ncbi:MAG: helix-turn-helix transcriptional regulator [Thermomicrobiales bacterium]
MDARPGQNREPEGRERKERPEPTTAVSRPVSRFPAWLRQHLAAREWSQAEFARRAGVSRNVVSQWAGGTRRPNAESAAHIADALYLPLDDVLAAAGMRPLRAGDPPHVARFVWMIRHLDWDDDRIAGLTGLLEGWMDRDYADPANRPTAPGGRPGQTELQLDLRFDS